MAFSKTVIIHAGRVGSTVLGGHLGSLPISIAGEIFSSSKSGVENWQQRMTWQECFHLMYEKTRDQWSCYGPPQFGDRTEKQGYVFEYKPHHPGCPVLDEALEFFDSQGVERYIFLHRKNYLRRYVSLLIAQSSGVWHAGAEPSSPVPIRLNVTSCYDPEIGFLGGTFADAAYCYYNQFAPSVLASVKKRQHLLLTYEDHIQKDPNIGFRMVRDFIGVRTGDQGLDAGYRRQNSFPLSLLIENYEELCTYLDEKMGLVI